MKIRYVLKNKHTGVLHYKHYTLETIERGLSELFDIENYEIISRDLFTTLYDKNGKEIYLNDKLRGESEEPDEYLLVIWNEKSACFQLNLYGREMFLNEGGGEEWGNEIDLVAENVLEMDLISEYYEIIGNIHEPQTTNKP